jgi:hypothetical protein
LNEWVPYLDTRAHVCGLWYNWSVRAYQGYPKTNVSLVEMCKERMRVFLEKGRWLE